MQTNSNQTNKSKQNNSLSLLKQAEVTAQSNNSNSNTTETSSILFKRISGLNDQSNKVAPNNSKNKDNCTIAEQAIQSTPNMQENDLDTQNKSKHALKKQIIGKVMSNTIFKARNAFSMVEIKKATINNALNIAISEVATIQNVNPDIDLTKPNDNQKIENNTSLNNDLVYTNSELEAKYKTTAENLPLPTDKPFCSSKRDSMAASGLWDRIVRDSLIGTGMMSACAIINFEEKTNLGNEPTNFLLTEQEICQIFRICFDDCEIENEFNFQDVSYSVQTIRKHIGFTAKSNGFGTSSQRLVVRAGTKLAFTAICSWHHKSAVRKLLDEITENFVNSGNGF